MNNFERKSAKLTKRQRTWGEIFKRALCILVYCGHKFEHGPRGTKICSRCGETFWNMSRVIHKHKRIRHNKWGKSFFKKVLK